MSDPIISVVASAAKPMYWAGFVEMLKSNTISYEIVLVGPYSPRFTPPDNFTYIYSKVKPAQCAEIGCRNARGEFVVMVADDIVFRPGALDALYKVMCQHDPRTTVVSSRFYHREEKRFYDFDLYFLREPTAPIVAALPMVSRQTWYEMGGIDSGFVAVCWDQDISLRMWEMGGKVVVAEDSIYEENQENWRHARMNVTTLYADYRKVDWVYLCSLWSPEGIPTKRQAPVVPFEDRNILVKTQGTKGVWK